MIKLQNKSDQIITNWIIKNPSVWNYYVNRPSGSSLKPIYNTLLHQFDRDSHSELRLALKKYKEDNAA